MIHEIIEIDKEKPNCEHTWYLMPYAIRDSCYKCEKCRAEKWILLEQGYR
jgi:NADH:ubiquinone oxidoreductase subunit F (NADH-binding)